MVWLSEICSVKALKMSKNSDNGTVSPPYPDRPAAYAILGKWGESERKMSNQGVKLSREVSRERGVLTSP